MLALAMLVGAVVAPGAAWANNSPCQGYFMSQATLELPPGYWDVGEHSNSMRFLGWGGTDETWGPWTWTVSDSAPLYPGQVMVAAGLLTDGWTPVPDQTINPAQDTLLWAGWAIGPGDYPSMPAAKADLERSSILFSWDGGDEVIARQGPYASFCANSLLSAFRRTHGPIYEP